MLTEKDIEEYREKWLKHYLDIDNQQAIFHLNQYCDMALAHLKACEQKPAAWIKNHKGGTNLNWDRVDHFYAEAMTLYARPVPPKEAK